MAGFEKEFELGEATRRDVDFEKCVPYFVKTYGCGCCLEVCPRADGTRATWLAERLPATRSGSAPARQTGPLARLRSRASSTFVLDQRQGPPASASIPARKLLEPRNMSQLVLPFAIMALTILVLVGIMVTFRKYLVQRDRLFAEEDERTSAASAATPARIGERRKPETVRHAA